MTNAANRFGLDFLREQPDQMARDFVSSCIRNNFAITEEFAVRFRDHTIILDGNPETLGSPKILFGGERSMASEEFELDLPRMKVSPQDVFSRSYRDVTSQGYRDCVLLSTPIVEIIECENAVSNGSLSVEYGRVLVPINQMGALFIACYSFKPGQARYQADVESTGLFQPDRSLKSTNLHMPY